MDYYIKCFLAGVVGYHLGKLLKLAVYKNCSLSGHNFKNNGNVDICSKCKLIIRKVEK